MLFVICYLLFVICSLVTDYWSLVTGHWSLVTDQKIFDTLLNKFPKKSQNVLL
ncbi:hypothetical protein [Dactylococcopsis salina]|uniref:hypothetical protein n=1 Tax=Dactylococcopsis salina TaxID=292566 RepID=UPI00030235E5|nr:hypothetical protein [Dactylococcopsis salina]